MLSEIEATFNVMQHVCDVIKLFLDCLGDDTTDNSGIPTAGCR